MNKEISIKNYRLISLGLAITFAIVGLIFLFAPNGVINFFNNMSGYFNLSEADFEGMNFFLILSVAYMYLVTILAFLMYKNPSNIYYPQLLAHAKFASSLISLYMFIIHQPYLIYISNFIVDGLIGGLVLILYFKSKGISE